MKSVPLVRTLTFAAAVLFATFAVAKPLPLDTQLPEPVQKTFSEHYPDAKIQKLDVDEEDGVTVYDIEFANGATDMETDITADGTMLEYTTVIKPEEVPAAAMKVIRRAAKGATMGRTERIELSYELDEGKAVKLAKPKTHYAVELAKPGLKAEIVVAPNGKRVEPVKWEKAG